MLIMDRVELERAIVDDPDDLQAWIVYADWLQAQGDPWGERIGLDLARFQSTGRLRSHLHDALAEHDRAMAKILLGERLAELLERPGFAATIVLERRFGLVLGARIGRRWIVAVEHPENERDREQAEQVLAALLSGTASRLLRSLALGYCDLDRACATVVEAAARTPLRHLALGWEERNASGVTRRLAEVGDLSYVLEHLPELRELDIEGPSSGLVHAKIERLGITVAGHQDDAIEMLRAARLPALRSLVLRLRYMRSSDVAAFDRLVGLLEAVDANPSFSGIERLHVEGPTRWSTSTSHALAERLVAMLARSRLLGRLRSVRLGQVFLNRDDGDALVRASDHFARLDALEVTEHELSPKGIAALERTLGPVVRVQKDE